MYKFWSSVRYQSCPFILSIEFNRFEVFNYFYKKSSFKQQVVSTWMLTADDFVCLILKTVFLSSLLLRSWVDSGEWRINDGRSVQQSHMGCQQSGWDLGVRQQLEHLVQVTWSCPYTSHRPLRQRLVSAPLSHVSAYLLNHGSEVVCETTCWN